jgi:molecular chaperone HscB
LNYFQLFGLTNQFSLDNHQLTELYQALQKTVHPDRFAHASAQEQLIAVQKSAMINDAYQTLKHPLKRAEYMLSLRDTEMPSEQASFSNTAFLMRQMELHEMMGDIKTADDVEQAIEDMTQVLANESQQLSSTMQAHLLTDSDEANKLAFADLQKLKFYQKLGVELERLEDQLFDD